MEAKKTNRNVFNRLFGAMIAFGLFTGIIFPFFAKTILHTERALSPQFIGLCLGAGLLVGLVNYLLFHLVISKELDRIIKGMHEINADIQEALGQQIPSNKPCELEITSDDRLGEVIISFNQMGKTIDERQRQERRLRELMNTLSDCVDLTFIGQIILSHLPAPPVWQHALLYVLVGEEYQCIALKNVNRDTIKQTLPATDLQFITDNPPEPFYTMDVRDSCFKSLELQETDTSYAATHITFAPLFGNEKIIALVVTACHEYVALTAENKRFCRSFCDHVEPYLRHALLHNKIQRLATVDELSQALNRRAGMDRLQNEYSAAVRHKLSLSLIMLDIDHFKKVNDIYGHQAGDMVIRELGRRLLTKLREEDVLFRYGGEEFVIILPHIDLTGAALCAERIRSFIREEPFNTENNELEIRISLGVVSWPETQASDPEMLNNLADKALYQAKAQGRDQVAIHTDSKILSFTEYMNSKKETAGSPIEVFGQIGNGSRW